MLEVAYPNRPSRFGRPKRSSSGAMMPLHRLDTLKEVASVDVLNEKDSTTNGMSQTNSSNDESHVVTPQRHFNLPDDNSSADDRGDDQNEAEEQKTQPLSPPPAWAAEPRDSTPQNPLLRRPKWHPKK